MAQVALELPLATRSRATRSRPAGGHWQASQGTAFIGPPITPGRCVTIAIRCRSKPGRMRYFVGCAQTRFDPDSGQAAIQGNAYSLENLKAGPHRPGRPCEASSPPCFHTGSVVTMRIDLGSAPRTLEWQVDSTGVRHRVGLEPSVRTLHPFVSLYNRGAVFELLAEPLDAASGCPS